MSLTSSVTCDRVPSVSLRRFAKFSSAARLRNSTNVICGFIGTFRESENGRGNWAWGDAEGWTGLTVVLKLSVGLGLGAESINARESLTSVRLGSYK